MRKSRRYPQKAPIHVAEFYTDVLSEGRGLRPDVYDNIPDTAANHPDELPLRGRILIVKTAQHARHRSGVVILHERGGQPKGLEPRQLKPLHEEPSFVAPDLEFYKKQPSEVEWRDFDPTRDPAGGFFGSWGSGV
jgi:hypothetical protein